MEALADIKAHEAKGYDYLFSVIIPIYNTEEYVREAIDSVLDQSVGFDCIQLILVNDGSTDSSGDICWEYQREHPNNVFVYEKENGGVASAINVGLRNVKGRWVEVMGSDDKWTPGAFEAALRFFHANDVPVVSFRFWLFGAKEGPHPLNYKYKKTRVVPIATWWDYPQLSISTMFAESSLYEGKFLDETLTVSEDFAFIVPIMTNIKSYGVIAEEKYLYRKRESQSSAMDTASQNDDYYFHVPARCHQKIFAETRDSNGKVPRYAQYCVMYDLQWRLKVQPPREFTPEEKNEYKSMLKGLLADIDEEVIFKQRKMGKPMMLYAVALKHGLSLSEVSQYFHVDETDLYFEKPGTDERKVVRSLKTLNNNLQIDAISRTSSGFVIKGIMRMLSVDYLDRMQLVFHDEKGEQAYEAELFSTNRNRTRTALDGLICPKVGFRVEIPWDENSQILLAPRITIENGEYQARFKYTSFCGLIDKSPRKYWVLGGAILRNVVESWRCNRLSIEKRKIGAIRRYEKEYIDSLEELDPEQLDPSILEEVKKWRSYIWKKALTNRFRSKRQWLICDRIIKAGDNGEAFFRYMNSSGNKQVEPIFMISEDSPDYRRVQELGKVVPFGSDEAKKAYVTCELLLSSSADEAVLNPFGEAYPYLKDLLTHDRVFLQHGVTKDDQSAWLNKYRKNFWRFVTSAPREQESIQHGEGYGYSEEAVVLSGFPRHDYLLEEAERAKPSRTIYLMPTWRRHLAGDVDPETNTPMANPDFEASDYYQFFQGLLEDEKLNSLLEECDCTMKFVLHPSCMSEVDKFRGTSRISVLSSCNYQEAFLDAACMITDYSSVVFDFALLKRPVAYIQFDADTFFEGHLYKQGYFSYEEDGFGKVCYDAPSLIEELEAIVKNDFQLDDVYLKRIEDFFFWPDEPRCRILERDLLTHSPRALL